MPRGRKKIGIFPAIVKPKEIPVKTRLGVCILHTMAMNYPVVIHKDADSDYGVTIPDLPGCFSAGNTIDEALAMAREAIELHLEGLIEDGSPVPKPGSIEAHQRNPDYAGGIWAMVSVDEANLRIKVKRINITLPEQVLDAVDRAAKAHHETRSGFLARAASALISPGKSAAPRRHRRPATRAKSPSPARPARG